MGISITAKDLKTMIRQEIEKYWKERELEEDKVVRRALQNTTEEEQQESTVSPDKIRKYCKRYGYMNTADFFKTVNNLARSQKGKLFAKSEGRKVSPDKG